MQSLGEIRERYIRQRYKVITQQKRSKDELFEVFSSLEEAFNEKVSQEIPLEQIDSNTLWSLKQQIFNGIAKKFWIYSNSIDTIKKLFSLLDEKEIYGEQSSRIESKKLKKIGDNWTVVINKVEYLWVWEKSKRENLFWFSDDFIMSKIDQQSKEWKQKNIRYAWNHGKVPVYNKQEIETILKPYFQLPVIWENAKINPDGEINILWDDQQYWRVWWPSSPAHFLNYPEITRKILETKIQSTIKDDPSWKTENEKIILKDRQIIKVYLISELEKLVKDRIWLPEVHKDGSIVIEWIHYTWLWGKEVLWIPIRKVLRTVEKQTETWKDNHIKNAIKHIPVKVINTEIFKELFNIQ